TIVATHSRGLPAPAIGDGPYGAKTRAAGSGLRFLLLAPLLALLIVAGEAPAQKKKKAPDGPVFVARTVRAKEVGGELAEVGKDWLVRLSKGGVKRRILGDEILSIRQEKMALPPLPADEHLVLANGDRLPVQDLRLENEKVY